VEKKGTMRKIWRIRKKGRMRKQKLQGCATECAWCAVESISLSPLSFLLSLLPSFLFSLLLSFLLTYFLSIYFFVFSFFLIFPFSLSFFLIFSFSHSAFLYSCFHSIFLCWLHCLNVTQQYGGGRQWSGEVIWTRSHWLRQKKTCLN
jgi:hypothetical protein